MPVIGKQLTVTDAVRRTGKTDWSVKARLASLAVTSQHGVYHLCLVNHSFFSFSNSLPQWPFW